MCVGKIYSFVLIDFSNYIHLKTHKNQFLKVQSCCICSAASIKLRNLTKTNEIFLNYIKCSCDPNNSSINIKSLMNNDLTLFYKIKHQMFPFAVKYNQYRQISNKICPKYFSFFHFGCHLLRKDPPNNNQTASNGNQKIAYISNLHFSTN